MSTVSRSLTAMALIVAATTAAAAQSLKPEWSRPVGAVRFAGVEENGRCSVFIADGVLQVVSPAGDVQWTWSYRKISKYINPGRVAISHSCDALAVVGDASYKYVWVVDRAGRTASIKFTATPADAEFDRTGRQVAIGTYAGSLFLYSVNGELQWTRKTEAAIVGGLMFTDDNQRIVFGAWGGAGVVSTAGHVEWSDMANQFVASRDLTTLVTSHEPNHGPGLPSIHVTDGARKPLWRRWASVNAFVSDRGDRILAVIDRIQEKEEEDFFGENRGGRDIQLLSRSGEVIKSFADYMTAHALSGDGKRMWLRREDHLACVNDAGEVLARIDGELSWRWAFVARDFGQVMIIREKDLDPVAIEKYTIPAPCRLPN